MSASGDELVLREINECFGRQMSASGDEEVLRETNECFGR